jgi:protein-tyrosine-phosphatase
VSVDELEKLGLRVISAGAYAAEGVPASPEAIQALRDQGIDLTRHRSRPLTSQLIQEADVIYCMTDAHVQAVKQMAPSAADKVALLDPAGNVEDPIGTELSTYRRCAELFRRRLKQRLKEQQV